MTYEENKMQDQIEGGLLEQKEQQQQSFEERREAVKNGVGSSIAQVFGNQWFTQQSLEQAFRLTREMSNDILKGLVAFDLIQVQSSPFHKNKARFKLTLSNHEMVSKIQNDLDTLRKSFKKREQELIEQLDFYSHSNSK